MKTTWYVATRAGYVLVNAVDAETARSEAVPALRELYADVSERLGRDVSIAVQTVRPATGKEIELSKWHHEQQQSIQCNQL